MELEFELGVDKNEHGSLWIIVGLLDEVSNIAAAREDYCRRHGASREKGPFKVCTISLSRSKFRYGIKL